MSPRQQTLVLELIAGRMDTLNSLLMMAKDLTKEWEAATLIDAAQGIAEAIGAMADDAVGGVVRGDMHCWLYGGGFSALKATDDTNGLCEAGQGRA